MLAVAFLLASFQLDDASLTPDQRALHLLGVVFSARSFVTVLVVWLVWQGLKEWREWQSLSAFAPAAVVLVFAYGVREWVYYGNQGEFIIWPLKVAGVLALIIIPRLIILDRRRAKHLEQVKTMPEPLNPSGAAKETDFKDWA